MSPLRARMIEDMKLAGLAATGAVRAALLAVIGPATNLNVPGTGPSVLPFSRWTSPLFYGCTGMGRY